MVTGIDATRDGNFQRCIRQDPFHRFGSSGRRFASDRHIARLGGRHFRRRWPLWSDLHRRMPDLARSGGSTLMAGAWCAHWPKPTSTPGSAWRLEPNAAYGPWLCAKPSLGWWRSGERSNPSARTMDRSSPPGRRE